MEMTHYQNVQKLQNKAKLCARTQQRTSGQIAPSCRFIADNWMLFVFI